MQPADFNALLDSAGVQDVLRRATLPDGPAPEEDIYQGCDGMQLRSQGTGAKYFMDIVRLSEGAFLIASNNLRQGHKLQRQVLSNSDWVHIQFRLSGGGRERISQKDMIETPEKSCIVMRYPCNSVIERENEVTDEWKAACLLVSPKALTTLLETPAARLPESVMWMADETQHELRTSTLPLHPAFVLTVNDIFSCTFRGGIRRTFMRAKALELLSQVINALASVKASPATPQIRLSAADLEKLSLSRLIMTSDLERTLTLDQLARRVGLSRTKLALGFKEVYGISVQSFWRDTRLSRARDLLRHGEARVTDVALSMGYSEPSSFTRAFRRKFGEPPRECRGGAA